MLAKDAAGLRERQLLGVVAREPQPVARGEHRNRQFESPVQQREIARPDPDRPAAGERLATAQRLVVFRQRIEAAVRANGVHVPLREHGAQPRRQAAASVKVAEQRPAFPVLLRRP